MEAEEEGPSARILYRRARGNDLITIITMLRFLVFCPIERSDLSHGRG